MFFSQLALGAALICFTILIHAIALDRIMFLSERLVPLCYKIFKKLWKIPLLTLVVLCIFCSHSLHIWIWAGFFLWADALPTLEAALYFSTTCYTTLGLGDVFLDERWRLLSAFEAANGIIMFGWSAAFTFEIMSQLCKDERIKEWNK